MKGLCTTGGAGVVVFVSAALTFPAAAGPTTGACCFIDKNGVEDCDILSADECAALMPPGVYQGDDTDCGQCAFERCAEAEENCQEPNIPEFPGGTILTPAATSDNFTATVSGNITSVCFWGAYIDPTASADCDDPLPTDAVTISFYADDGDTLPPAPDLGKGAIFLIAEVDLQRTATGQEFGLGGFDETVSEYEWTATLPGTGFAVTAGVCYWIQVENDTGDPDCGFYWEVSPEFVNDPDFGDGDDASHDNDSGTQNSFDLAWCIDQDLGDLSACGLPINPACGFDPDDLKPGEGSCSTADGSVCSIEIAENCMKPLVFVEGESCLNNCDEANPTNPDTGAAWAGCLDAKCCTLVCVDLPLCCQDVPFGWDAACAEVAISLGCAELLPDPCPGLEDFNCQLPDLGGHGGGNESNFITIGSDAAFGLRAADNFTPATGGVVTEACWYGIYVDMTDPDATVPCDPLPDDSFTVTYYLDDGNGLPGAMLDQFVVTPTRVQELEFDTTPPFPQFLYSATHDSVTVEEGQCYWIEIQNNLDGICVWEWSTAPSVNEDPPGTGDEYAVLKNLIGGSPCPWDCEAKPNGDVGINDFLALLAQWSQVGTSCDFDGGGVGINAFLELLANWGACPAGAGGNGFDVADGVDVDFGFCVNVELADPVICAPPVPMQQCDPGDFVLTQSLDLINQEFGLRCLTGAPVIISQDTGQARSYDLAQGKTAGQDVSVSCVEFGVSFNDGGAITVTVNVYEDPTGGVPVDVDLVADLLGSVDVLVPARVFGGFMVAVFDPPLPVGVDKTIVVEVFQPSRTILQGWPQTPSDGGDIGISGNMQGQTGPSYFRSDACGFGSFTDNVDIGLPQVHFLQELHLVTQ